jgi:hypothetical protein
LNSLLFCKSLENYDNSNPVNAETFAEFIDYSKAVHVARAAYAGNCVPNMNIEPGYEKVHEFVEKARRSPGLIAPKELRGKFQLCRHYPFRQKATVAHLEPNDVTRVQPDLSYYEKLPPRTREAQYARNELLDTLKNGSLLGGGMTADEVREAIINDT